MKLMIKVKDIIFDQIFKSMSVHYKTDWFEQITRSNQIIHLNQKRNDKFSSTCIIVTRRLVKVGT